MGMSRLILLLVIYLLVMSCSQDAARRGGAGLEPGSVTARAGELVLPAIPPTLTESRARAAYLLGHYWDNLDFSDTSLSLDTAFMEQNFANFVSLFPLAGADDVRDACETLLGRASADKASSLFLLGIAEKYLYEPDSPLRDEESYILFAEAATKASSLTETETARTAYLLECARKNRPGTLAADFGYTTPDGRRHTLRRSCRPGAATMLIFYDPDCASCKEILAAISADDRMAGDIRAGRLYVIAVYPGEDRELWERTVSSMPAGWTVGLADSGIEERGLYVLPVLPVIYILDEDGTVLAKDPKPHEPGIIRGE